MGGSDAQEVKPCPLPLPPLPGTAQLAFTLELTGWESYPVDEYGEFMTGRAPEERAATPFRKYSNEWIEYRVALEMLDQTILEGYGTLHADYYWTWLVEGLEKLVAGEEDELRAEYATLGELMEGHPLPKEHG